MQTPTDAPSVSPLNALARGLQPLSDAVYAAISDALRQGRYPAGSRLVEHDLASALQVSRTPVRDAAMAADHITRPQLEELDRLQHEMERLVDATPMDVEQLVLLNGELHRRITAASNSPRLIKLVERLHPQYMSYQVLRLYSDEERRRSIQEHREILDALWRRDGARAETAIHGHLEHGKTVVLANMLRETESGSDPTTRTGRGTR
jgi:DNA-binding GntR family transcriptional regulator